MAEMEESKAQAVVEQQNEARRILGAIKFSTTHDQHRLN